MPSLPSPDSAPAEHGPTDLRMVALAAAAWAGGLAALLLTPVAALGITGGLTTGTVLLARRMGRRRCAAMAAALLVAGAVACSGLARQSQVDHNPLTTLARDGATVVVEGTVVADPRRTAGAFGEQVLVRLRVHRVTGRGTSWTLGTPVLVLGDTAWKTARLGSEVRASGRLVASDGRDVAGLLLARGAPRALRGPGPWWRAADAVRASLRDSVRDRPEEQRALVPALVDGDDAGVDPALADDFRATGLTHLLAVSGTNLTLLVGFLLVVARWTGVRGRWLHLVGALGIAGFVLLARTEPSVVRAAVMGTVGLVALGSNGRERGSRTLAVAVVVLLLVEPGMAGSVGFALSVLATAGILLLGPPWRDALARWLPRWAAEAVAVPAVAQLACTPLVAAISGQVSLVAVGANLVVAPAVGPATVLGLWAGLVGLVWPWAGRLAGTLAGWCVSWIVTVARHASDLPVAALDWGTGVLALAVLTLVTVGLALAGPHLLRRRGTGLACCTVLVAAVLVRVPTPGWPPTGWVLAVCDVGQGDALVLDAAPHAAVVVDAGPDPAAVDACLRRLEVTRVPLLVLTHFHADHVGGVAGVFSGRTVGAVETTRLQDPPDGVRLVDDVAAGAGLEPAPAAYGVTRTIGAVRLQVLWPLPDSETVGPGDGSTANEASVVLLAEVGGTRLLLAGDIEPEGQAALARAFPDLRADVLKVPHHGSRYQDLDFLLSLGARLALVSVGADNDYGHPAASTLAPFAASGARVLRTDRDGDLAVVVRDDRLGYRTAG